jgi:predicted DNA-binding protein (MmcQ/YjbR family)
MATARDFQNPYQLTDLTSEIQLIPNTWGLVTQMGLYSDIGVSTNTVTLDKVNNTLTLLGDSRRGTRHNTEGANESVETYAFSIPHFQIHDRIEPKDLQGRRRPGTDNEADTLAMARMRKLERMQKQIGITKEYLAVQGIKGNLVTPNGNTVANYYTSFGVSQKSVDFVLGTATTKVGDKIEEVIAHIQDNILSGDIVNDIVVLCSPTFFQKLVTHAKVESAYQFYMNTNQGSGVQVLRDRLGSGLYRSFSHQGLVYIEYRGSFTKQDGTVEALIEADTAYAVPLDVSDLFEAYNGPADHLDFVNTLGESMYSWEYQDPRGFGYDIFAEFNTLHLNRMPQAVVKCVTSN